jgi:hypothetical protein
MSIQYSAKIMVGLPRDEIENEDVIDDLVQAAPYYDGGDEAIVGICVVNSGCYQAKEFTLDQATIDAAKANFKEQTGQDGKLYLTPNGY